MKLKDFFHRYIPILRPVLRLLGIKPGTAADRAAEIAEKVEEASRK